MSSLVIGTTVLNVDQWDGYPPARRRLLDHIADGRDRRRRGAHRRHPRRAAPTCSSPSAAPLDERRRGRGGVRRDARCSSGRPASRRVGIDPETFDPTVFGLAYAEVIHRGYCRCTVTPDEWRTEFVIVADHHDPDSEVTVDATLTVQAGTPAITIA